MEHQNIARVLDAGATDSGRPYFVMELVRGIPVTDYCRRERLSPEQRLHLFIDVCRAVQHAHHKGVIHRDIKPSNVMVTLHDGEPVVKMIDFGVAKATTQQLTDRTLFTNYAQIIGTPLYMSPEQAEMSGLDVDTRSDIYSLGVLLYELLTDTTPFEKDRLKEVGYDEMRRIICEEDPPKPSTRLSTISSAQETISDRRRAEARRMRQALRGDLDWIVIKALEKNRQRRYQTAKDFADDVQRYIQAEPVEACPPSVAYRARKLLRKYRAIATAVGAIGLILVIGTIVATSLAVRAIRAEKSAALAQARAENEAATATAISNFLRNELLGQASPFENPNRELRLREVLDQASERIDGQFDGRPLVEAEIRQTLATTYYHLGEFDESARHFDVAYRICVDELGPRNPKTMRLAARRAFFTRKTVGPEASVKALEATLKLQEAVLPSNDPDTLRTMAWLAGSYVPLSRFNDAKLLFERTIPAMKRVLGLEHPHTLDCLESLASMYSDQERYHDSEELHRQILESRRRILGEDHPQFHDSLSAVADLKLVAGNVEEALDLYDKVVDSRRRIQGKYHPSTLADERGVAKALRRNHRLEAAEKRCLETLKSHRERYGNDDGRTRYMMDLLAAVYQTQARYDESLTLREAVLASRRRTPGNNHENTIGAMYKLANLYVWLNRFDEAIELYQEMIDVRSKLHGDDHPKTMKARLHLSYGYQHARLFEDAERVLIDSMERWERIPAADPSFMLSCTLRLGNVHDFQRNYSKAEPHFRKVWNAAPSVWGAEHKDTLDAGFHLAAALWNLNRLEEAEQLCCEVLAARQRVFGKEHFLTADSIRQHARICRRLNRMDEAAELFERVIKIRRKIHGDNHSFPFAAINNLANLASIYEKRQDSESARLIRDRAYRHIQDILKSQRDRFGNDHDNTLDSMRRAARVLVKHGHADESLQLQEEIVAIRKRLHGLDNQKTLRAMARPAISLSERNRHEEAERLSREVLAARSRVLGEEHSDTLDSLNDLAEISSRANRLGEARDLLDRVIVLRRKLQGDKHAGYQRAIRQLYRLSFQYREHDDMDSTVAIRTQVCGLFSEILGETHKKTLEVYGWLLRDYRRTEDWENLYTTSARVIELRNAQRIQDDPPYAAVECNIDALLQLGRLDEAEQQIRKYVAVWEESDAEGHDLADSRVKGLVALNRQLATVLLAKDNYAEAESILLKSYDSVTTVSQSDPQLYRQLISQLVKLYETWGKQEQAAHWLSRLNSAE